jgi:uncharacterized RDD family membrane protein YckC
VKRGRCAISSRFHTQNIRTPEGVVFSLMLASPVVRMLAWLVDILAILTMTFLVQLVAGALFVVSPDFAYALIFIIGFLITVGYGITLEWLWNGQTLGKRMMRLRVVDENGLNLHFGQIVVRNLLRFVDQLPAVYFVGGITSLINSRAQRLGDLAAGTIVIRQPRIGSPDVEEIIGGKYNSFSQHPYLEARLCSMVTPREASLAVSALMRRNEFDDVARVNVFKELAAHFKTLVKFPEEITEDISDEQFVRNVVCSVYKVGSQG